MIGISGVNGWLYLLRFFLRFAQRAFAALLGIARLRFGLIFSMRALTAFFAPSLAIAAAVGVLFLGLAFMRRNYNMPIRVRIMVTMLLARSYE